MYLFFVRDFNDIDHITPIVWKMKGDDYPVAVYCINPEYDVQSDYRLSYLKKLGVEVDSVYNLFDEQPGWLHRFLRALYLKCLDVQKGSDRSDRQQISLLSKGFSRFAKKTAGWLYNLLREKYYNSNWARNILERSQAKVLCFDWIRPHKFVVEPLLKAANAMAIPTVALPHGVFLYTNDFVQTGQKKAGQFDRYNHFDYVIVQNRLFKETITKSGVPEEKISVLGSARYCKEWMDQNNKILPRKIKLSDDKSEKLKVIFMTTRPHYRIDVERMLKTFDLLAELKGMEIVVKPHTRSGKEAEVYDRIRLANVYEYSSVELCEWADVMLVIGSSILIETLVQRKPVLYLKYLHENITEYEEMGACWTIHNEQELLNALAALQSDLRNVPYSKTDVDSFLAEIVFGGAEKRDVLQVYAQFIVSRK